jgi:hypothetical protein
MTPKERQIEIAERRVVLEEIEGDLEVAALMAQRGKGLPPTSVAALESTVRDLRREIA